MVINLCEHLVLGLTNFVEISWPFAQLFQLTDIVKFLNTLITGKLYVGNSNIFIDYILAN